MFESVFVRASLDLFVIYGLKCNCYMRNITLDVLFPYDVLINLSEDFFIYNLCKPARLHTRNLEQRQVV